MLEMFFREDIKRFRVWSIIDATARREGTKKKN